MSILQKFEKFALTKEQGNVIKGGLKFICFYGTGKTMTGLPMLQDFNDAPSAMRACSDLRGGRGENLAVVQY